MNPTNYVDLPTIEGETIANVIAYRVEYRKIPKWQFWRTEKVKVNLAVLTTNGRFYIVDPDNLTVNEKPN